MNSKHRTSRSRGEGGTYEVQSHAQELAQPLAFLNRLPRVIKRGSLGLLLIVATNAITHGLVNPNVFEWGNWGGSSLYLMDKAEPFVMEPGDFQRKVKKIASRLDIYPEWLMAVMYSESKFDPTAINLQGTGAVGLIQFSPRVAQELGITSERLLTMDAVQQLDYVYKQLLKVQIKHGAFETLTELYLAVLAPEALGQDYCYTLYAKPSEAYRQNVILDENQDGSVTVSDIDQRMQRMFPTAYWMGSESVEDQ